MCCSFLPSVRIMFWFGGMHCDAIVSPPVSCINIMFLFGLYLVLKEKRLEAARINDEVFFILIFKKFSSIF